MDKEELDRLCKMYGYSWSVMGEYIEIVSKRDTYFILNLDHEWRRIELRHLNEHKNSRTHSHGKHKDLCCIFSSIFSHDNIYKAGSRNNKFTRITNDYKRLGFSY